MDWRACCELTDSEEKTSIWNSEEKTYTAKMSGGGGGGFVLFCFVFNGKNC